MRHKARSRLLLAPFTAALLALCAIPAGASEFASKSDAAGDAYKTSIAKAKEKRAAKLKACANKPKAKQRAACRKGANTAYATAKAKAEDERDDARYDAMTPEEQAEMREQEREDFHKCMVQTGDLRQCKS